jgi:misacylated tRNA(Ala) deacylase
MTKTEELFREDAYRQTCEARVAAVNHLGGIIVDRTVFYPTGGGQPGDSGTIEGVDAAVAIATTLYDKESGEIVHVPAEPGSLEPGQDVACVLDWPRRHLHMRVHSCLHLLCALLPYPVTGGAIGQGEGRLDFDIPEAGLDKEALTEELNALIARDAAIGTVWISEEELDARPELVRTMAVQPPRGSGRVRLIEIEGIDLQPCGGTHVARTGEIGTATVTKIEKKGAQNRRVRIVLG